MTRQQSRVVVGVMSVLLIWVGQVAAQLTDFEPVTDEMLESPDPDDWLSWRRTLDGWGYSPLDQIDTQNVSRLQLVWSWQLRPGLSEPTPLVYNGVMYIPGPLGVVQALDGVTGDLLWEYRKQFEERRTIPSAAGRARSQSTTTRSTSVPLTPISSPSTRGRAMSCGITPWPTTVWGTATRVGRSS